MQCCGNSQKYDTILWMEHKRVHCGNDQRMGHNTMHLGHVVPMMLLCLGPHRLLLLCPVVLRGMHSSHICDHAADDKLISKDQFVMFGEG